MIVGHNKQKKYFNQLVKNDSLSHAYLLSGIEKIGKRTFALELAKAINGRPPENDPDFKLISPKILEDEFKIYIEDVRDLKSFLAFKPYLGPYKFAIINDAHFLTTEASNALLKILEEPPSHSIIFLISSIPGLLPSTIASRCEEIKFLPASPQECLAYLEDKKINSADRQFLNILSSGRIGLIADLLEDKNLEAAKKSIGDLRHILNKNTFEKMNYAKKIHEKEDYRMISDYWLHWVSAHLKNDPKNRLIVKNLLHLSRILSQPQYNHRLALENFLINL